MLNSLLLGSKDEIIRSQIVQIEGHAIIFDSFLHYCDITNLKNIRLNSIDLFQPKFNPIRDISSTLLELMFQLLLNTAVMPKYFIGKLNAKTFSSLLIIGLLLPSSKSTALNICVFLIHRLIPLLEGKSEVDFELTINEVELLLEHHLIATQSSSSEGVDGNESVWMILFYATINFPNHRSLIWKRCSFSYLLKLFYLTSRPEIQRYL